MAINKGFKNEYDFAKKFDKKFFKQLNKEYKELIKSIYNDVDENDLIECWVSRYKEKSDLKIRVNGNIKGISIKMGHHNSVHMEHIKDFYLFLNKIGIDNSAIEAFEHFINWKEINPHKVLKCYKIEFPQKCIVINNAFNDYYIKMNMFIRFLFQGNYHNLYSAHALIYGTPDNFLWATRNEIIKYLLTTTAVSKSTIYIGLLSLQILFRDEKYYIQIKWHSLDTVLEDITNARLNSNKKSTQF